MGTITIILLVLLFIGGNLIEAALKKIPALLKGILTFLVWLSPVLFILGGIMLMFYLRSINSVIGVILVGALVTWYALRLNKKMDDEERQEEKNKIIEELKKLKGI